MKKCFTAIIVFLQVFMVTQVMAKNVLGTSVNLTPPEGFIETSRFSGFINEATGASIVVTELPGPFINVVSGFSDEKRLQQRGMKLLDKSLIKLQERQGILLNIEQSAYGKIFRKWIVAIDLSNATTVLVATFLKENESHEGKALKEALLAVSFGPSISPMAALSFSVKPVMPFKIAKVMGQNLFLSPNGDFPIKDKDTPFMIISLSASKGLLIPNQKKFAVQRIMKTADIQELSVSKNEPVTIGTLSGYTTIANGKRKQSNSPVTIYQVLLFDSQGYVLMQGFGPSSDKHKNIPIFKKISDTFTMKK